MNTTLNILLLGGSLLLASVTQSGALPPRQHSVSGVITDIDQDARTITLAPSNGDQPLVFDWKGSTRFSQGWPRGRSHQRFDLASAGREAHRSTAARRDLHRRQLSLGGIRAQQLRRRAGPGRARGHVATGSAYYPPSIARPRLQLFPLLSSLAFPNRRLELR